MKTFRGVSWTGLIDGNACASAAAAVERTSFLINTPPGQPKHKSNGLYRKKLFCKWVKVSASAPISWVLMSRVCEDLNNNVNIITIPNENVKCLVTAMNKYYTKNGNCKTDKSLVELLIKIILICVRYLAMHGTHFNVIVITLKCKSFTMFFSFFFRNN